tara:strand:- start:639 stop:1502 length:864 start_codon:yes stop_codon:yes gene_type:complete
MGTNKSIYTILEDLPDNNNKAIIPENVRQIANSIYTPQMILAANQTVLRSSSGEGNMSLPAYKCNYYNPYFFTPQATTKIGLGNRDQIWQITNFGNSTPAGTYQATVVGDTGAPWNAFGPTVDGKWEVVIDDQGQLESYKVIEPAQGWVSGTLQQGQYDGNSYWDQTGSVVINGNQTIKVTFHGPLKCVYAVNTSLAVYEMTINENDPTNQFPGQGSTGAADHTINNSYALLADQQLDTAAANIGTRIGGDGNYYGTLFEPNLLFVRSDNNRSQFWSVWRTPGGYHV